MPRERSGAGRIAISTLAACLLFSVTWAAQPNDYYPSPRNAGQRAAAVHRESLRERGPPGPGEDGHDLPSHDKTNKNNNEQLLSIYSESDFELETLSASQTFAPARHDDVGGLAVRAPVPAAAHPSAPIHDRSLQDWVMEDMILMATVDGSIHARDRRTGQHRWSLDADDYPMVETTYNRSGLAEDDILNMMYWVVEPSSEGELYLYLSGEAGHPGFLQKLQMSIKRLVDTSPYSVHNPHVVYNADRTTTLYNFDAKTGDVLAIYGKTGSSFQDKSTCRMPSAFGGFVESECKVEGSISLGRVTYNIWIQTGNGDHLCSIRYSEWVPNKRDTDLQHQYRSSMDQSYVYTSFNGRVTALKHDQDSGKGLWTQQLSNPVTRVFDVVRPAHTEPRDTELVLLPQPLGPMSEATLSLGSAENLRVYVNRTKPESFYALSELTYPTVTKGAKNAQCYDRAWIESIATSEHGLTERQRAQSMIGVHRLPQPGSQPEKPSRLPGVRLTIDGPGSELEGYDKSQSKTVLTEVPAPSTSSIITNSYAATSLMRNPIDTVLLLLVLAFSFLWLTGRLPLAIPKKAIELKSDIPEVKVDSEAPAGSTKALSDDTALTTQEPLPQAELVSEAETRQEPIHVDVVDLGETVSQPLLSQEADSHAEATIEVKNAEATHNTRSRSNSLATEIGAAPKVQILEPRAEETDIVADELIAKTKKSTPRSERRTP